MTTSDDRLAMVGRWVAKAENDLRGASRLLAEPEGCPTEIVCFPAQQCAEKYIKAVLVAAAVPFPKVHDIENVASLLPSDTHVPLTLKEMRRLTSYAVVSRYPTEDEPVSLSEARRAVRLARRVRAAMRRRLPKSTRREM